MRALILGILMTSFFSLAGTCHGAGGKVSNSGGSGSSDGGPDLERPVAAVPEPSGLMLGAAGALLVGLAIRRNRE